MILLLAVLIAGMVLLMCTEQEESMKDPVHPMKRRVNYDIPVDDELTQKILNEMDRQRVAHPPLPKHSGLGYQY